MSHSFDTVEYFNSIDFHDTILSTIDLNLKAQEVHLSITFFEETTESYSSLHLSFFNVSSLIMKDLDILNLLEVDIHSFEVKNLTGKKYRTNIICVTGFGNPAFTIQFEFDNFRSNNL